MNHPLSKYGLAIALFNNNLDEEKKGELNHEMLIESLKEGLNHFRLYTDNDPEINDKLTFKYYGLEELYGNADLVQSAGLSGKGKFLSQNIITEEKSAKQVFAAVSKLINLLKDKVDLAKSESITMSISPVSGKFNQGKLSQSNPKSTLLEVICYAIGNTHPLKPSFNSNNLNYGLIPDLPLNDLNVFIRLFRQMYKDIEKKLLEASNITGKYKRPRIIRGNYPDAPNNSSFGPIGLIAAIGKWSKESQGIDDGMIVLDLLKNTPIYLFGYGKAEVLQFNHYIVELAKSNKLYKIILDLENSILYSEERKSFDNPKYQQFHLFTNRFLQLFNESSFKDFLAFRAEYKNNVDQLLTSYFINIELNSLDMSISKEIVTSAREMGRWLNYTAYKAAVITEEKNDYDTLRKAKAKFLVELESAAFSSKSGSELISHVVTRAGRLTGMDIPSEAQTFMDAACEEIITLEQAQHLLTAYSRLKNAYEKKEEVKEEIHSTELN